MFGSTIRNRLIASFLLLIFLTLASLGAYMLLFFKKYNMERLTDNLFTEAKITEELLHRYMDSPGTKPDLDEMLKELSTKVDLRVTLIGVDGNVLADSWENPALMENHAHRPEITDALTRGNGTAVRYSTTLGQNLLYAAIPIVNGKEVIGIVRVSTTLAHVDEAFRQISSVLLLAFLVTSLLAIALSLRLARRYTAPLEEISAVARQIGLGHLDRRVHLKTGDEIELLGRTLNNLASNLEDRINDITAEKRKLELVLEHMDNAVVLLDRFGRLMDANRTATRLFDLQPTMFGQHNIQVIGSSALDKALRDSIANGANCQFELKTNLQGCKRTFEVFLAPIRSNDQAISGVVCVFHDITTLNEVYERQSEFVANASHELSTPLTAIKGFSETLLDGAIADPELSVKFVGIIHTEAERMHRLVQDLLQLARLGSVEFQQQARLEPTLIKETAELVMSELASRWQAKGLAVDLNIEPKVATVLANPDWLKQVLMNLLDNAIKYTPPEGSIRIGCERKANEAVFTVSDSGSGIPPADLPYIFDRFYRVDRARARSAGGSGLGLAIAKFMVETMGGTISAASVLGLGTTITFTLPLAE